MNKYIQQQADYYAGGYPVATGPEVDAKRTAYIAGAMMVQDDIMADLVKLRDNYMRQLQVPGRPREAIGFIAGKLEAINAALDILERYERGD